MSMWLYSRNDGHEKTQLPRNLPCPPGPPLPPPPRVGPQRHRLRVGIISPSHSWPPTLHWRWSPVSRAPPRAPGHGQQKLPITTMRADSDHRPHRPILFNQLQDITAAPSWLHMHMLWSTQSWSKMNSGIRQNAVNKRISKSWNTNPNLNVLFEVRIFDKKNCRNRKKMILLFNQCHIDI